MGIYGVSSYYAGDYAIQNQNRSVGRNSSVSNNETIGNATSLSESSDNGKRIGITTVGNLQKWNQVCSYSDTDFGMVSSKEYWLGFFEGAEVSDENYMEAIREQIEEMQEKIENGEINETFQIGNQTFTVEEWNEFLEKFDSIEEVLEALMKERHTEMEKQQSVKEEDAVEQNALDMIISESTSCTYPASDTNGEEIRYITCYTEEGIFCKKAGLTDGYEWSISFESKKQYDKVMEFIGQFSDDEDLRFTANEKFWKDFLKGDTDVESLKESIRFRIA
ncbi:MAG: hypothetical protein IKL49_03310 [Lachnospiraceae bacterium]|nr:hypothetical protein [Lachnospiraceae bacterium]